MSDNRNSSLTLFLFAVTLPLTAVALVTLVPKLATSDEGRVVLLLVLAPVSIVMLLACALSVARLIRRHWLKRHAREAEYGVVPPLCKGCGYDLRASPDVCPDCGTPVARMDGTTIRYVI